MYGKYIRDSNCISYMDDCNNNCLLNSYSNYYPDITATVKIEVDLSASSS